MSFTINKIGPGAAEITGLDCAADFSDETAREVKNAFFEYPVLVFRDQDVSPKQLAAFGRHFGALERYSGSASAKVGSAALKETSERQTPDQMLYQSPEDPDVMIMTNEVQQGLPVIGIVDNAETWHSDASHKMEPCSAIAVHVVRNIASGGDTEFCDLRAVYDALTPDIKKALDGRIAWHHWSKSINPRFAPSLDAEALAEGNRIAEMISPMHQPVIRTHPGSHRRSLYLSPRFTLRLEDMPEEVSSTMLHNLFAFAEDPAFCYRHQWKEKDLMIWDNRCLNHRVWGYPSRDVRRRHRVTVAGDRPFFARESA